MLAIDDGSFNDTNQIYQLQFGQNVSQSRIVLFDVSDANSSPALFLLLQIIAGWLPWL